MMTFKRLIFFYFINLTILFVLSIIIKDEYFSLNLYGYLIVPLIFVILGQIIGFFTFATINKENLKAKIFFNCSIIVSVILVLLFTGVSFSHWKHNRDFGNIEANEEHFKYYILEYKNEEKIAFESLSKKFSTPNAFGLTGGLVHIKDTLINGHSDTIYFVTFRYFKQNRTEKYKANIIVFKNKAQVIFFDKLLDHSDELQIDSLWRKGIKDIKDALEVVPDSIRKEIKENFKEVIDN